MEAVKLLGIILWPFCIWLEVARNYKMIEVMKEKPVYLESFFVRAFMGFICLALYSQAYDPIMQWHKNLPFIVYQVTLFYLVFDLWLNKKRGKAWDYQGKDSGWLDKLGKPYYYFLKGVCLILFVLSIYVLWKS